MVILTSPKPLNQEEENQRLNQELSDYLSKYGFGFREAKGHYTRRVDEIKGISNFIEDYALVISGKESEELLFKLSVKLCEKYQQESILYKNSLGEITFCNAKGKVLHKLGRKFKADKVGDYMARLKNAKSFEFDKISKFNLNTGAGSFSEGLARQ